MKQAPLLLAICSIALLLSFSSKSQQIVPIKLVTESDKYSFAISGILTGDIANSEFSTNESSKQASGQIFLDANISDYFSGSVHINAVSTDRYFEFDSLDLSMIAFSQNHFAFNLSFKGKLVKESNIFSAFTDYSLSTVDFTSTRNWEFPQVYEMVMHKLNLGFEYSWIADWDQDLVVNTSFKYNYLILDLPYDRDNYVNSVFRLTKEEELLNRYSGISIKTSIQLNNISFFFETQNNFKAFRKSNKIPIEGFIRRTFYSIGFTTTSTAILAEKK